MTLDLEVNEVEAKVLTSLASVTGSTDLRNRAFFASATAANLASVKLNFDSYV